jgi:hypothetical protein
MQAKIATLKQESEFIHLADVLYWKRNHHSRKASVEYEHRQDRLQDIRTELALYARLTSLAAHDASMEVH